MTRKDIALINAAIADSKNKRRLEKLKEVECPLDKVKPMTKEEFRKAVMQERGMSAGG